MTSAEEWSGGRTRIEVSKERCLLSQWKTFSIDEYTLLSANVHRISGLRRDTRSPGVGAGDGRRDSRSTHRRDEKVGRATSTESKKGSETTPVETKNLSERTG